MIFPKHTRKRIYSAAGKPLEVAWPKGEPIIGNSYQVEAEEEGKRKSLDIKVIVKARRLDNEDWRATIKVDGDPVRLLGKSGGYTTSSQGAMQTRGVEGEYELEAVDSFTQRRLTLEARLRERQAAVEVIVASEDVLRLLEARAKDSDNFRKQAGRSIYRIRAELNRQIQNARRKAA